jgi:hypothetical protein
VGDEGRWPIFLLGAPRSGTSLLYKCLALHPAASWISNYVERAPRMDRLAYLNRVTRAVPALRDRVWFGDDGNAYVYASRRSLWRKALPMPTEGESVFARAAIPEAPIASDAPTQAMGDALRASFRRIDRASGGQHLVCKRIANNLRIPLLVETFPNARFVLLTRDGRAVASSLRQVNWWPDVWLFWYGSTPRRWEADGGDPWVVAARHWVKEVEAIESGLPAIPPAQLLSLSYEDFVASPVSNLEAVAAFTGLGADAAWSVHLGTLSFPDNNERWRTRLSADVVTAIEREQHATLARHGYSLGHPSMTDPQSHLSRGQNDGADH